MEGDVKGGGHERRREVVALLGVGDAGEQSHANEDFYHAP